MQKNLIFALSALAVTQMSARSYSGRVFDSDSIAVPGATVSLIALPDSTLSAIAITDVTGRYSIEGAAERNLLVVECVGFERQLIEPAGAVADVYLRDKASELTELVVSGSRPVLKSSAGKYTFDPRILRKEVNNTLELLKFTPLLEVEGKSISILGIGSATIYIDGRETMFSGKEAADLINSYPPSMVKKIEIITNPGSSYSASMRGGIVNIILEHPDQGVQGSIYNETSYYSERITDSSNFWLGYTKDKFQASAFLGFLTQKRHSESMNEYEYKNIGQTVTSMSSVDTHHLYGYANLNFAYDMGKSGKAGLSGRVTMARSNSLNDVESRSAYEGAAAAETEHTRTSGESPLERPSWAVRAYYEVMTNREKRQMLKLDANYYTSLHPETFDYDFAGTLLHQSNREDLWGANFKASYIMTIAGSHTLNFGYEFTRSRVDWDYDFYEQSNRFRYNEMLNSGYAEWSNSWGDRWSTRLGLRVENTHTKGEQTIKSERNTADYTDLFPSLSVTYSFSGSAKSISLNFRRDVTRPVYLHMNPFVTWTSENTCTMGNPDLVPSYMWWTDISAQLSDDLMCGVGGFYSAPVPTEYTYGEDGVSVTTYSNTGHHNYAFAYVEWNKQIGIWRTKNKVDGTYTKSQITVDDTFLGYNEISFFFSTKNSFAISRKNGFYGSLSYSLSAPSRSLMGKNNRWRNGFSVGLSKSFPFGLSMALDVYPLDERYTKTLDYAAYRYRTADLTHHQSVYFRIQYTFGKRYVYGAEDRSSTPTENRVGSSYR